MANNTEEYFRGSFCEYSGMPSPDFYTTPEEIKLLEKRMLSILEIDRIIEMAWEDRTTFEAIKIQFGLSEKEVIALMRKEMKASSFRMWRKRTNGRSTKHEMKRVEGIDRFKCTLQRQITMNKMSKR
jgi:uncharacterized protein (TIGR03643 family)